VIIALAGHLGADGRADSTRIVYSSFERHAEDVPAEEQNGTNTRYPAGGKFPSEQLRTFGTTGKIDT